MPRAKKSFRADHNPPKRRPANRRKAKSDPTSEFYASQEQERPSIRTKSPRKTSAKARGRTGGAIKERGKKTAATRPAVQHRA